MVSDSHFKAGPAKYETSFLTIVCLRLHETDSCTRVHDSDWDLLCDKICWHTSSMIGTFPRCLLSGIVFGISTI